MHELDLRNNCTHLKFTVYGHKQASKYTHARTQCSHASVGLAQAHSNNHLYSNVQFIVSAIQVSGCSKPKGATNLRDPLTCKEQEHFFYHVRADL